MFQFVFTNAWDSTQVPASNRLRWKLLVHEYPIFRVQLVVTCLPHPFQMMQRDPVSKLCDVYSFGIFVWELVTRKQPFSDVFPPFMVMTKVAAGEVGVLTQSVVICIYVYPSDLFVTL